LLSATKNYIISPQASKPNISIVQDSLLGAYLMTKGEVKIDKGRFFDICMRGINVDGSNWTTKYILEKIELITKIFKEKGKKTTPFIGKSIFSLLLPNDFIYNKKNDADKNEPIVKIYRGILLEGAMNKSNLGASHNSIIQVLNKEYGPDIASTFVDNVQFVTNGFLEIMGFSVGIEDCIATKDDEIEDVIEKCFIEAKEVEENTHHAGIREMRISAALSKAKDIGLRIAKEALDPNNNFVSTVTSGSKGDFFNIAQVTGLLGQQNLTGKRIEMMLNQGKRSLPHYPFEGLTKEMEYESRGFVKHSFIHGLNPQEFYFHAMSGREGVTDTAMGTSKSGYIQRRIVKCLEDMQIQYDGTVRNASGFIYQCSYGYDGMDTKHTVKVKDDIEICDISRIVDRLNMEVDIEEESKSDNKLEEVVEEPTNKKEVVEEPKKKSKKDKKSEEKQKEVVEEPKKKSKNDKKSEEKQEVVEEPKKDKKPKEKKEEVEEPKKKSKKEKKPKEKKEEVVEEPKKKSKKEKKSEEKQEEVVEPKKKSKKDKKKEE